MIRVRGRIRQKNRGMNRTEKAYADFLYAQKLSREIADFWYESLKFRLADRTWYTPDFVVFEPEGWMEIHEVKGHWEDDARVKVKVAAEQYPYFRWKAVRRDRDGWHFEEFGRIE